MLLTLNLNEKSSAADCWNSIISWEQKESEWDSCIPISYNPKKEKRATFLTDAWRSASKKQQSKLLIIEDWLIDWPTIWAGACATTTHMWKIWRRSFSSNFTVNLSCICLGWLSRPNLDTFAHRSNLINQTQQAKKNSEHPIADSGHQVSSSHTRHAETFIGAPQKKKERKKKFINNNRTGALWAEVKTMEKKKEVREVVLGCLHKPDSISISLSPESSPREFLSHSRRDRRSSTTWHFEYEPFRPEQF